MANNQGQATDQSQQPNTDTENREGSKLPIPVEPAKTIKERVAKSVPYEDSGYSEAGLLDDGI